MRGSKQHSLSFFSGLLSLPSGDSIHGRRTRSTLEEMDERGEV